MTKTAAIRTLEYMRENGWMKAGGVGPNGERCLGNALARVTKLDLDDEMRVWMTVEEVIKEQYPDRWAGIPGFNDHSQTTFADIERVLEKVDVKLQEGS